MALGLIVSLLLLSFVTGIVNSQSCSNIDADVLVLGGGIAGIAAGKTLHDAGVTNFMIIEAQSQIGGRLKTVELRPDSGIMINAGANWIQGFDTNQRDSHPLWRIANSASCGGIDGFLSDYDSLVVRNSRGMDISDSPRLRYDDYDTAIEAAEQLSANRRAAGLPDITVRSALNQSGWIVSTAEDEWVEWFGYDYCFAEPPDGDSLFAAIPLATYTDFGEDTGDFFISDSEGFFKVVRCLADEYLSESDSRLHLNTRIRRILWSEDCVCVETEGTDSETNKYCGRYAILTFSLGVLLELEQAGIEFVPPLPEDTVNALRQFSMTHYLNIVIEFEERFWEDVEFIGYINETDGRFFPLFKFLTHVQNANVLFSTITEELADRVLRQTEEETKQELIDVINAAYNLSLTTAAIHTLYLPDWDTNPLFLGSYSNIPIGVTNETYATLHTPLGDRLYISGEVTSQQYSGFVHGGLFSGVDSANDLLAAMGTNGGQGILLKSVNWCLLAAMILIAMYVHS